MKTRVVVFATITMALSSCNSIPLRVPEDSSVTQLKVLRGGAYAGQEFVIEDPRSVERLLAFLKLHDEGWRKSWDKFPTPQYTVTLKGDQKSLLVLWIGPNWIGGREGDAADNRLRFLSAEERTELSEILGVSITVK